MLELESLENANSNITYFPIFNSPGNKKFVIFPF